MSLYKPKRVMEVDQEDLAFGICVWQFPDGSYLQNDQGDYFSAQGPVYDIVVEKKMRDSVKTMGITNGKPFWLPGMRKITNSEWEDQMERLQDGKIPDPVDVYRQIRQNGKG